MWFSLFGNIWKNWLKVRFYLPSFCSIFLVSLFTRYRNQFWLFIHYHRIIIRIRPRKSISLFMTLKLCFRTQFNYHLCPVMPGKRESVVNFWYLNALIIVSPILKGGKMDVSVDCWLLWWISWPKGLIKVHRAYNIDVEKRDKKNLLVPGVILIPLRYLIKRWCLAYVYTATRGERQFFVPSDISLCPWHVCSIHR